jgi:hypothetical protein
MSWLVIRRFAALLAASAAVVLAGSAPAAQAKIANKFVLSSAFGWDVNKTAVEAGATQAEENLCTVASKDECQIGQEISGTGGFNYPKGVAVDNDPASPDYGDVYIADFNNARAQVFTASGAFVSMFGSEVNKTAVEAHATQAEENLCTAESDDECQSGTKTAKPGQFYHPYSISIDPNTGDVYLAEYVEGNAGHGTESYGFRVQAFTAQWEWLFEVGQEVNATTKANLCSQQEVEKGDTCTGPTLIPVGVSHGSGEPGTFDLEHGGGGNLLALGGPEDLLYVGDEHRVQEFTATGEWRGEIPLASLSAAPEERVRALGVDEAGDVYLAYGTNAYGASAVHEFAPDGAQTAEFEVPGVETFALDPHGRLAVTAFRQGILYSATGVRISEFTPPSGSLASEPTGAAFSSSDELYVTKGASQEIETFAPALFPESATCAANDVTATSATLCGQINPNGLLAKGFFEYGPSAGSRTPIIFEGEGETFEPVAGQLTSLVPNQTYTYKMAAEAQVNGETVNGSGEPVSFHTATPPPEIAGAPTASNIGTAFGTLSATVNPEHAPTHYHFEYGRCPTLAGCAEVVTTPVQESSVYGSIAVAQEAAGLQPGGSYSFRLLAENEHEEEGHTMQGGSAVGAEGHFSTPALPTPIAETGAASAIGANTATISGLVNPDGQASVYSFELGVYRGAETRYGIVYSGPVQASSTPVPVSLGLSGLQPGTTYAFRLTLRSGYGESAGATVTFTTEGLSAVLPVTPALAMLPVPNIELPTTASGGAGKKAGHGECAKQTGKHAHRGCVRKKSKKKPGRRGVRRPGGKR